MFVDEECCEVCIASSWKEQVVHQSMETQTSPVPRRGKGVQAPKRKDAETNCDERELRTLDEGYDEAEACSGFDNWRAPPAISKFLDYAGPMMERALAEPKYSDAFEDLLASQTQNSGAQLQHVLTVDFQKSGLGHVVSESMQLECTDVAWNATGTSVVASYGRRDIRGWCELPGVVCVWNLSGRSFKPGEPDHVFEHDSCLMCVCCHPKKPGLIAAGSYYGEVVVWDAAREEPLVTCTRIAADTHSEPIAKLMWAYDPRARDYVLVSVGSEGNVVCWSSKHDYSEPASRITIPASVGELRNVASAGGSTGAFTTHTLGVQQMLLGTAAGRVLRCAADAVVFNPNNLRPSFSQYQSHVGAVRSIAPSPFQRNLFVTVGWDRNIRLFNALDATPVYNFVATDASAGVDGEVQVFSAQFSPTKPGVFAVAASHQCVFVFDVLESDMLPVLTLRVPADPRGVDVTALAFNHRSSALLACSDSLGRVSVFQLGSKYTTAGPREQQQIDQLARVYRSALG